MLEYRLQEIRKGGYEKNNSARRAGHDTIRISVCTTETLAAEGYHVYAGARKDKDLAELDAIENITAVRLDVTNQEQIDAAVEKVRSDGGGLYGLVNNAGVGGGDFVADTPIDD